MAENPSVRKLLATALFVGLGSAAVLAMAFTVTGGNTQGREWPMDTVPQDLFEEGGTRLDAEARTVSVSESEAASAVLARNPGSTIRESRLASLSSAGPGPGQDRADGEPVRTVWAVSIAVPEEPQCRGCAAGFRAEAIERLLGYQAEPGTLTDEQWSAVNADIDARMDRYLSSVTDVYHVEFIDAETGEWIGGAAGFRGPG